MRKMTDFQTIVDDFALLDEWEDRYRYLIELGQTLTPLADDQRNEVNKVRGCVSQVWLVTDIEETEQAAPRLRFTGDSDAHIVRGLIAVLFAVYSGKTAQDILTTDGHAALKDLALEDHLTPQRSNGLAAMIKRMRDEAAKALAVEQPA